MIRQLIRRENLALVSPIPRPVGECHDVIPSALIQRVDARLRHLEQSPKRDRLSRKGKEVSALTAPQIDRKSVAVVADKPILVAHLNRPITENTQFFVERDGVSVFVEHRDDHALTGR